MRQVCGRKWGVAALSVVLAASAVHAQEEKSPELPRTWYARALARSESELNVSYFWSKGPKLRAETVISAFKIVTIVNGDTYYAYDAVGGRGVAIRRAPEAIAADASGERPFGRELDKLLRQGAEKVGEQTIMGRPCDLYRVTDLAGKRELCVTQDTMRLPVRVEVFSRATGRKTYTDFVDWISGLMISDAFFEPDDSVELKHYTLEEYLLRTARDGPVSPVPVLFADLLHGKPEPVGGEEGPGRSPTSPPD